MEQISRGENAWCDQKMGGLALDHGCCDARGCLGTVARQQAVAPNSAGGHGRLDAGGHVGQRLASHHRTHSSPREPKNRTGILRPIPRGSPTDRCACLQFFSVRPHRDRLWICRCGCSRLAGLGAACAYSGIACGLVEYRDRSAPSLGCCCIDRPFVCRGVGGMADYNAPVSASLNSGCAATHASASSWDCKAPSSCSAWTASRIFLN